LGRAAANTATAELTNWASRSVVSSQVCFANDEQLPKEHVNTKKYKAAVALTWGEKRHSYLSRTCSVFDGERV